MDKRAAGAPMQQIECARREGNEVRCGDERLRSCRAGRGVILHLLASRQTVCELWSVGTGRRAQTSVLARHDALYTVALDEKRRGGKEAGRRRVRRERTGGREDLRFAPLCAPFSRREPRTGAGAGPDAARVKLHMTRGHPLVR